MQHVFGVEWGGIVCLALAYMYGGRNRTTHCLVGPRCNCAVVLAFLVCAVAHSDRLCQVAGERR